MQFIEVKTEDTSVFINVGNIMYISERRTPAGTFPVLFMMNGMALAITGHTMEEILGMCQAPNGPKTDIPDAFRKSFDEMWEMPGEDGPSEPQVGVDTEPDEGVIYRDGGDEERSDDDLLPT